MYMGSTSQSILIPASTTYIPRVSGLKIPSNFSILLQGLLSASPLTMLLSPSGIVFFQHPKCIKCFGVYLKLLSFMPLVWKPSHEPAICSPGYILRPSSITNPLIPVWICSVLLIKAPSKYFIIFISFFFRTGKTNF